ncbi:ParB/RepB/Spo0J family partition protein [Clostridium oryzae]|uniref:Putative chromosome-partitioning protein ParB n=1 Tax=Clostridium oryzae TaxID=1450648 RepID=A0A1V4IGL3_9CLOT|nr:ParB/RepB/Spo0J family partition protein [Clostridium oryzae]OPJ58677.1 putative chromosome-partitioning protein ParB [Clostridium oryzae]
MAVRKHGLGKGLDALIPKEISIENERDEVTKININKIKSNDDQPRKYFDEDKIAILGESIKEHGLIQPVVVKQDGEFYSIIAGERRWRAAKLIGLKEIPVVIMNLDDRQTLEISLIENIQREDLNPIEEANAYKKLMYDFDITQEELSQRIGKSRTAIANSIRLINLDERVRNYLIDGVISEGHGRALLSVNEGNLQYELAQRIIDDGLSVRQTEKLVKSINSENKSKTNRKQDYSIYYENVKEKLESYFDTKVVISANNKKKGKIEIEYYSEEDLNRIIDLIKM